MGQYHKVVNLDKCEYVLPHRLGCGLKLLEQLASQISTGTALIVLLASASNGDGGGDFETGPSIIGSWRGDRIAFVGDYDDKVRYTVGNKKPKELSGSEIYSYCDDSAKKQVRWTDVSDAVCAVIEAELGGKFSGDGWRDFKYADDKSASTAARPDMVLVAAKD